MNIEPIATVRSCFGGKFGAPRQPGLCPAAWGRLVFHEGFGTAECLRGLEEFSHLWLIFGFHETAAAGWHPTVRPPRLGGNTRVGVFASRSNFRPNPLGLSLVALEGIEGNELLLGGLDLIDGTPVFDLKPYLPYAESLPDARASYATNAPQRLEVTVAEQAADAFAALPDRARETIRQALALDPRPAATGDPDREFGASLCGRNVRFRVHGGVCQIVSFGRAEGSGLFL